MSAYRPNRLNENTIASYRNDRFYCDNDEWYFAIRRGPDQGPYPSKEAAQAGLRMFIAEELALERRLQAEQQLQNKLFKQPYDQRNNKV